MPRTSTARDRLIDSARDLIHCSSYGAASVDDLCRAAGVNKGSFYYFFPSKRDLALAAIDAQWASARERVLDPSFAVDTPPLERIRRFFHRAAEVQRRPVVPGCPFGNLAGEMSTMDEAIRDRVRDVFDGYRRYFAGAVADAIAAGDVEPVDVETASEALLAYFQGALLLGKTRNDAGVIERLGASAPNLLGARHG